MTINTKDSLIQKNLFRKTCLVMVCQELSQVGVGFIDGLIISIFLGSMSMAASGLIYPFFSIIGMFSGMMMLGTQKLFVDFLGKGELTKAQSVLSTAIAVSIITSLLLFLLLFAFSGPVVRLLVPEKMLTICIMIPGIICLDFLLELQLLSLYLC